jgi:hypothetical protein
MNYEIPVTRVNYNYGLACNFHGECREDGVAKWEVWWDDAPDKHFRISEAIMIQLLSIHGWVVSRR